MGADFGVWYTRHEKMWEAGMKLDDFKPTWMIERIYQLTPEQLIKHNIKGVITDLDNTLIAWNNPDGTPELRAWLTTMKEAGIPVVILSNNHHSRVKRVADQLGIQFTSDAKKPSRRGYRRAIEKLGVAEDEVVIVGDQLLTDVWGGNRLGIRSILVMPIVQSDAVWTLMNRKIERSIFKRIAKANPELKWRNNIV